MNEIRTYMPFTAPVDPVRLDTIADMDLSYALASTLIEWDERKQVRSALAQSWTIDGERAFRFTLRKNAQWSDGSPLTSEDVKRSFVRAMKAYPEDLRSLINILDTIECSAPTEIVFTLKVKASDSDLLKKLTEPNFGVLKVRADGSLDLSATTGPFFVKQATEHELTLHKNPNWYHHGPGIAEQIVIRRPSQDLDTQTVLFKDTWPNLAETSSLIPQETLSRYEKEGYAVWRRPTDKVFLFYLGKKRVNEDHFALLRYLSAKLDRGQLAAGLTGFTPASQLFPVGYALYDSKTQCKANESELPTKFQGKPLEVLISPARVTPLIQENLRRALRAATGTDPHFISVPLQDLRKHRLAGNFDFYAGTMGQADPAPEGIMSYYYEGELPVVPSSAKNNFLARLDEARRQTNDTERLNLMRKLVADSVCEGHVLPLFHLSTIGIGRAELDFSQVPASDESVTLSKIRFSAKGSK